MKHYSDDIDAQDLIILRELQSNTITNVELARRINLSAPATHARVKRLEALGYLKTTKAVLDREKLGFVLLCFITVALQMHKPDEVARFRETVINAPEVLECHHVTGDYDYILKVALRGRQDLQRFLMDVLTPIEAVARLHTRVVLDEVKSTTALPL